VKLDIALIRERRQSLGMSGRELGRRLGRSSTWWMTLENGRDHDEVTLGFLERLSEVLEVEAAALLGRAAGPQDASSASDTAKLEAALAEAGRAVPPEQLAAALGWPLSRLTAGVEALRARQAGTGLRVYNGIGLHLRPAETVLGASERRRLHTQRRALHGLRRDEAQLMLKVLRGEVAGEWEQRAGNNDRVTLGTLLRQGLVKRHGDGYRMTPAVGYSLSVVKSPGKRPRSAP
jgi:transcriptional regulator with XRE-family HTH domain